MFSKPIEWTQTVFDASGAPIVSRTVAIDPRTFTPQDIESARSRLLAFLRDPSTDRRYTIQHELQQSQGVILQLVENLKSSQTTSEAENINRTLDSISSYYNSLKQFASAR
jgi:hypothetical protein